MLGDGSVDFAFSWDSLVHVEEDVMASYVRELRRVLRPGGCAFLHHSNRGAVEETLAEKPENHHWRARSMTAEKLRTQCVQNGLVCPVQELVAWGGDAHIDVWSLIRRPLPHQPAPEETRVVAHDKLQSEQAIALRLLDLYGTPERSVEPPPVPKASQGQPLRYQIVDRLFRVYGSPELDRRAEYLRHRVVDQLNQTIKTFPRAHAKLREYIGKAIQ
jgi:hypothetical protein